MRGKPSDIVMRAAAETLGFAVRVRRMLLGRPADEVEHWWDLRLPGKLVARTLFDSIPSRLATIYDAPGLMSPPERLMLYAMVYGLRPKRVLEIGTFHGGSAMIIVAALDDIGEGSVECVDPAPQIKPRFMRRIKHRAKIHTVPSPEGLAALAPTRADRFDFALIDGDHSYAAVIRDIEGVRGVLADDAVLLFHDSHYYEVAQAIDAMLARHSTQLIDCGQVSTLSARAPDDRTHTDGGQPIVWGGLRMLRWTGSGERTSPSQR